MKNHNEKLINHNKNLIKETEKISKETLHKSKDTVKKLTHPSKKVSRIGSVIGGSVGVGLVVVGATGLLLGRSSWGAGSSLIAGAVTVVSNVVNIKKNKE